MLDLTKPMQLRDGEPVRLLGQIDGPFPLVFAYNKKTSTAKESVTQRPLNGQVEGWRQSPFDVINVPPEPVVKYTNVYETSGLGFGYKTLLDALSGKGPSRCLFVVKETVLEGQPTDYEIVHVYGRDK